MNDYENRNKDRPGFESDGSYRISRYTEPEERRTDDYASERHAYSDAEYVSAQSAAAVPPRYHYPVSPEIKPKRKRTRQRGLSAAGIVALCLCCSILGGVCGFLGTCLAARDDESGAADSSLSSSDGANNNAVISVASPSDDKDVQTVVVPTGEELTGPEIYKLACSQVVAITTDVTVNYYGFVTTTPVSGSGFIISDNGYILTNHHVVSDAIEGGYEVTVYMYDGTQYTAEIVGYEEDSDVAVLRIDAAGLSAATLGDSDSILVGETARVVGNPLGELQYTMTSGEVSALDREITTKDSYGVMTTINMFQIDAAVNSGNSGGPVYNSRGEVIGIVTAKYGDTGVEGLGFAIPINDAIAIAGELIENGYVSGKAYMGVSVQTITSTVAQYYNLVEGAYITLVEEGSAAESAGLREGDVIVQLGDKRVTSQYDLVSAIKDYLAGDTETLTIYRDGRYTELTITFDEDVPDISDSSGETQQSPGFQFPGGMQPGF